MWMYLCIVNKSMKAYYVKYDNNDVVIVDVFYEACYVKYARDNV